MSVGLIIALLVILTFVFILAGIPVYVSAVVYTAEGIRDVLRKDHLKGKVN